MHALIVAVGGFGVLLARDFVADSALEQAIEVVVAERRKEAHTGDLPIGYVVELLQQGVVGITSGFGVLLVIVGHRLSDVTTRGHELHVLILHEHLHRGLKVIFVPPVAILTVGSADVEVGEQADGILIVAQVNGLLADGHMIPRCHGVRVLVQVWHLRGIGHDDKVRGV